jgi:hypothetical protein
MFVPSPGKMAVFGKGAVPPKQLPSNNNLNPIVTQATRFLRYSTVLFCLSVGGAMAGDDENLIPDGADIEFLERAHEDSITEARIVCAAGEMPDNVAASEARGGNPSPVHAYCHAVVREAANREHWARLYTAMQGEEAVDEYNLVLAAAGDNLSHYTNVDGIRKELPCELAFDAGYIWFSLNRHFDRPEPSINDDQIDIGVQQCFDPTVNVGSYTGLVSGARLAYRDIQDRLLAGLSPEATPAVPAHTAETARLPE